LGRFLFLRSVPVFKFTIRWFCLLVLISAIAIAWYADRARTATKIELLEARIEELEVQLGIFPQGESWQSMTGGIHGTHPGFSP
jgi:hypothetical protein